MAEARIKPTIRRQSEKTVINLVTALPESETVIIETEEDQPAEITLAAPYAYYDENGVLQSWSAGQIVKDAAQITLLISRGAVFE